MADREHEVHDALVEGIVVGDDDMLERYLEDHFLDDDARLVLAANYLFGGRPAAAVDLLESPFSAELLETHAGKIIMDSAKAIQYGSPEPAGLGK